MLCFAALCGIDEKKTMRVANPDFPALFTAAAATLT